MSLNLHCIFDSNRNKFFSSLYVVSVLVLNLTWVIAPRGTQGERRILGAYKETPIWYSPIDSGFVPELNHMRCADYKGHVKGKSRWPYSCLLPAAHLATGRLYDGTSSLPERVLRPPWLNLTLFEEGQRFARENSGHLLISHLYGLFTTNLFLDSKEVLLFWGGFDSPSGAARRYTRIANMIFSWYRNAPPATDFPTFDEIARSIRDVRMIHRNVSRQAERMLWDQRKQGLIVPSRFKSRTVNEELWNALKRDVASSPIHYENRNFPIEYRLTEEERRPLNQFIQAMTMYGFVGYPVLLPERIGLTNATKEELFAFNHLWAVIAYCVGIRDEFNISLQPDLYTTRKYFQDIFETFIEPAFFQIDFYTKVLIDPLLEGINSLEFTMTPGVTVTRVLRNILRIPTSNTMERLKPFERLALSITDVVISNNSKVNRLLVGAVGENVLNAADIDLAYSPPENKTLEAEHENDII